MEYTLLGRSGLRVSVVGLGCGGPSRLGQRQGKTKKESVALIRRALELGVNFFDTAEVYDTEGIIGEGIREVPRERVVISTKKTIHAPSRDADPEAEIRKGIEESLRQLKTDYVDVYHLHGVEPREYSYVLNECVPVLLNLREEGKIRCLGITEGFVPDPKHETLQQALGDDCWDVVMVGFNLLNQSARSRVLTKTRAKNIGVLNMFAVRRALSRPEIFRELWDEIRQKGLINPRFCRTENPLSFLLEDNIASTIPEAAYRYCRHEPGVHVVLTGTGNPDHLKANVESLLRPPLPAGALEHLREVFANVDSITGN